MIDLFAGAGGLSLGFKRTGFSGVLAVELREPHARTFAGNLGGHMITGDILRLLEEDVRLSSTRADVVIGGPPCQGFSNLTGNRVDDPRRRLWRPFMEVAAGSGCRAFVIENVPNILAGPELPLILEEAGRQGFMTETFLLRSSLYGVPQCRKRAFIIGSKVRRPSAPPPSGPVRTVRWAFRGIPDVPHCLDVAVQPISRLTLHIGRRPTETSLARYRLVPPGGNRFDLMRAAPELTPACWLRKPTGSTDVFGRLRWDEPARCTIRCEFYKPEKGRYLHPEQDRPITHWEAARLQGFPDAFLWYGNRSEVAEQIGNAVPPPLAEAVAAEVLRCL